MILSPYKSEIIRVRSSEFDITLMTRVYLSSSDRDVEKKKNYDSFTV